LIENHATDDARRIGIGTRAPDLRLSSQIKRQVEEAILEVLNPRKVGKLAAVGDRDADGRPPEARGRDGEGT
jgi:hypothetical protein